MAYPLDVGLALGAANTGLTLEAQIVDTAGVSVGDAITTGFVEFGATGNYLWHTAAMPDAHRGGIVFQVSPGGAIKAFVAINGQEVENPDVKTSTRSSHSAAAVWAVGTRELTGFGTLVADTAAAVWAAGTRTLTSFGTLVADTAAAVWAAGTRTLTSFGTLVADVAEAVWTYVTRTLTQIITAVDPPPVITGDTITLRRGDTATLVITGLGSLVGRTKLWFTVKLTSTDTDAEAILQVEETAGLLRLNGEAATAGQGSIVVDDEGEGDITITIAAVAMAQLQPSSRYEYDVQMLAAAGVDTLTLGSLTVIFDVTAATS